MKSSILRIWGDNVVFLIDLSIYFFKKTFDLLFGIIKKVFSNTTFDMRSLTTNSKNDFIFLKIKKAPNL